MKKSRRELRREGREGRIGERKQERVKKEKKEDGESIGEEWESGGRREELRKGLEKEAKGIGGKK